MTSENGLKYMWNMTLQWCHKERDGISNHQPHDCLLHHLFMRRSKKTSKLCVIGLCEGNSPMTSEFPALKASNEEDVTIWLRHHGGKKYGESWSTIFLSRNDAECVSYTWFSLKQYSRYKDYIIAIMLKEYLLKNYTQKNHLLTNGLSK